MTTRTGIMLAALGLAALATTVVWLTTAGQKGPVVPPPTAGEPAQDRVAIYHYWDDSFARLRDCLQQEAERFNAGGQGVRLQPCPTVHEAYKRNARAMLADAATPEWYSWWAGWRTRDLAEAGLVADLDARWQTLGLDQRFPPALLAKACTYGGTRRLVPLVQAYVGVFYSKASFRQAGITAPPATWSAFTETCRRLRATGLNPVALGVSTAWPAQYWFDYLLLRTAGPAFRARLLDGTASYEDPAVRRTFALWRELIALGAFNPNPASIDWVESAKLVQTQGAAMTLMGTWVIDLYSRLGWQAEGDYGFFPFPSIDAEVEPVTLTVVDGLVLSRTQRDTRAAFTAIDHLTQPEVQLALANAAGGFAPHRAIGPDRYDPLRRSIRSTVDGELAFPYDLSTPPEVERIGLELMVRFLENPDQQETLLREAAGRIAACFARRAKPGPASAPAPAP
jgi:ABC-type glycerol-3-phosphate transport system substrate-binding protein